MSNDCMSTIGDSLNLKPNQVVNTEIDLTLFINVGRLFLISLPVARLHKDWRPVLV